MKIVCDNCGAKYSIADEKVAGKVFKIRCKKCTNVIVVRGDQVEAEVAPDTGRTSHYDYGGDAVWHVVVDGDQQGPFDPAKLGEMLGAGTIDWEAYVWREGFEGWKPAKDVPELADALGGAAAAPASTATDPFGGSPEGASAFAGESEGDGGADLFAPSAGAAFDGGAGGAADDDIVASPTPSPRATAGGGGGGGAMTGQRNENSVLFSLSNLQALATGDEAGPAGGVPDSGPPAAAAPVAGMAAGEGSGLIDIRALASATTASAASTGGAGGSGGAPADLLSIGGSGGGVTTGLGAPVLAPAQAEPEKSNKGMAVGLGVIGVAVLGLAGAVIYMITRPPEPPAVATREVVRIVEKAAPATANPAAPEGAAMAVAPVDATGDSAPSEMHHASRMRHGGSMDSAAPAMSTMRTSMGSRNLESLLDSALSAMMSSAMMSSGGSNLPEQPARNDVASALRGASSRVQACGSGTAGVANAKVTFGSNGRVRGVRVTGVAPNVASCVARGVRGARVPPFRRPTFEVNYPFRVR